MKLHNRDKLKKDDRVLVLKIIDGERPLTSLGMVDKSLFTGGNNLHAVADPQSGFWRCYYDHGKVPEALSGTWTSYERLLFDVEAYLRKRNIEIEKVID
jgi:hypothetical protein